MAEQPQDHLDEDFTDAQQLTLAIVPRIAACISLISASYMAVAAFQQRSRIYHRLMLGLTIHLIQYAIWNIYGPAAVPVGTLNVWGAAGTTETCTAKGFFTQVSHMAGYLYYDLLALHSFQAVRNNFNEEKYIWMEKWIHGAVNIFPFGSAFYLLSIEAFNFTGTYSCWIASIPFGCGDRTGTVCERGPQNPVTITIIHAAVPYIFILVFPTIVMVALYVEVRRRQASIQIKAKVVAKQAGLYLLALYWAFIFAFINQGIQRSAGYLVFVTSLLGLVNLNLNGFWFLLIYLYFRVSPSSKSNAEATVRRGSSMHFTPGEAAAEAATVITKEVHAKEEQEQTISFNIFDGTNAGGAFSQFIFDADSDDGRQDRRESIRWDHDVQNFI